MATVRLRDRDAIITKQGLIFRVLGYAHPPRSFICDAEYASDRIFKSNNPKAPRNGARNVWYKFYEDEGWKFLRNTFPEYLIFNDMLQKKVVGVDEEDVLEAKRPQEKLRALVAKRSQDDLLRATQNVLDAITGHSTLDLENFGVFGSLLHDFYHPKYSDIDLTIYGKDNALKLSETLKGLFGSRASTLTNEFASEDSVKGKNWRFQNFSLKEYWWHQRRKLIYAVFDDQRSGRKIKVEFEPIRDWKEIKNDYDSKTRVQQIGWVKVLAQVTGDEQVFFIPSIYRIEPREVIEGPREVTETTRILSYVEEFRKQASADEVVYVEGNLEKVITPTDIFYQIALTYCPRYYEQALKVKR